MAVLSDIEIARENSMAPIEEIASKLDLKDQNLQKFGHHIAKIDTQHIESNNKNGKLILVTAISPTPAGEGKTTTSVGLSDGLNKIGKQSLVCLREPSLGPCFGVKGGAAGGGYAQVVPMDKINLQFTPGALDYIVEKALQFKLGARGLRSLCEAILNDAMYELPNTAIKELKVTKLYVDQKLSNAEFSDLKIVS